VADHVHRSKRSLIMAAVQSEDTGPEMAVRKISTVWGIAIACTFARYRRPDLVFRHAARLYLYMGAFGIGIEMPVCDLTQTHRRFWEAKFDTNEARDRRVRRELRRMDWSVLTVWQCELKKAERLTERLSEFLSN